MDTRGIALFDAYKAIYWGHLEENKDDYTQSKFEQIDLRFSNRGSNDFADKVLRIIVTIINPKIVINTVIDLNTAKWKFMRTFLSLSLRDLAKQLEIPHPNMKLWEDQAKELTGLEYI